MKRLEMPDRPPIDLPPQGKYGFVGRKDELKRLERAFRKTSVVLLTGPAGVGKTELACEFARRLFYPQRQTSPTEAQAPQTATSGAQGEKGDGQSGVFFTAFEYGAGLCRILHEMGTTLQGIGFARLSLEQQRQRIIEYLKANPCLLIWDNFENALCSLDDTESQELVSFLHEISGDSSSHILITSRGKGWGDGAGIGATHLSPVHKELKGLKDADTQRLAGLVLESAGVDAARLGPAYLELLALLRGNPMSMKVVLPHLKQRPPSEVVQALQSNIQGEAGESDVMDAALECSFSLLSPRTRAHLPFLALFQQRVLLDVLTFITQGEAYASVMGENMAWGACRTFLKEARDCDILDSISPSVYLVPPVVSWFLRRKLNHHLTPSQVGALEREFVRVYADLGDYFLEHLSSENSDSTVTGVLAEEANLLHALHLAEMDGRWEHIQLILQPLGQVYKMQERVLELRRLRERLLSSVGHEAEQAEHKGAIDLWMYLRGSEVNDAIAREELEVAEGICHTVLRHLESVGDSATHSQMASVYHHLGLIAQGRSQYEQAEGWYHEALKLGEPLGNEAECADSYHQLGLIAHSQRRHEEAEGWHRRALEIRERLEDEAESASECHQLALVAEARSQVVVALDWYQRARTAYERLGDKVSGATVYHRLGLIAQAQYDYEEAAGWHQKALLTYEELDDQVSGSDAFYQLGVISLRRHEYEEAENWLLQALDANERRGDEAAIANICHQLGVAAHAQQRHEEAEKRYQKALEIYVRLGDDAAAASTWGQLGLLADQQGNYYHAVWYVAHTYEIAIAHRLPLLRQVKTHVSALRSKMGTEAFVKCWQEVSDTDVLSELE